MPEAVEAEMYRRSLDMVIGGIVIAVDAPDALVVPDPSAVKESLIGGRVLSVTRHGKNLVLVTDIGEVTMGFGMTGRLIVGELDPVPTLVYGTSAPDDRYDRFAVTVHRDDREIEVRLSDPRRLARVRPGRIISDAPDVTEVTAPLLSHRARSSPRSRRPLKSALLDQNVVAGLGNMLADDVLWRSSVHPQRPVNELTDFDWETLASMIHRSYSEALERGGSHRGDLASELRHAHARCPSDDAVLERRSIGGRTSWFCPVHQR